MIYFEKSPTAPDCLETEKLKELEKEQGLRKTGGKYDCGCVLEQLQKDSKNKCYICESKEPTTIHIEHFKPHKEKDINLKFDWNNLFFACGHCNNTKLAQFDDILNCTDLNDDVEHALKYEVRLFPHEPVNIEALNNIPRTEKTKELLLAVFNGTATKNKILASGNLCKALIKEIRNFQDYLFEYDDACDEDDKNHALRKIKSHLNSASAFTAFKRQIIKNDEKFNSDFSCYIQS